MQSTYRSNDPERIEKTSNERKTTQMTSSPKMADFTHQFRSASKYVIPLF